MNRKPTLVLGASGNVGSVVAQYLLNSGVSVIAVARNPGPLQSLSKMGAEVHTGSMDDQSFLNKMFDKAGSAFILTPGNWSSPDLHAEQQRYNENIVRAIKTSGVSHVVLLSSWGAELPDRSGTIWGCYHMEQLLNALPDVKKVYLRPVWFMDNFIYNIGLIKMASINGLAIDGDFSFPCIDTRDIGHVAAEYLAKLDFKGTTVRYLQGARDYTMEEVTSILGDVIEKKKLGYAKFPASVMMQGLQSTGKISGNVARLLVETNEKINEGRVHGQLRSPENTTPTTLERFSVEKFLPAYLKEPQPSIMKRLQGVFLRTYLRITVPARLSIAQTYQKKS